MSTSTETDPKRTSEFAIASLTMGIVTFVNLLAVERAVPAIVFGVLALRRMKADDHLMGKRRAVTGIVLGIIGVLVLPTLGLIYLPKILPTLRGLDTATVRLQGSPDPAEAAVQLRDVAAAFESTQAWLDVVDAGQYADAWEASARANKVAVAQDEMVQTYNSFRPQLGAVVSRKLKSASYTASLPDAPLGEYVMIEFSTTFAGDDHFTERITPMREGDGQWKVSGYYLLR